MEIIIILLLICWPIFNVLFYIPNQLKKQEEKLSLHFKEIQIRLNRLEKLIEDKEK